MNATRIVALARKELIQIWRDPRSLTLALLLPIIQMLLLGYGVTLDIKHLPLCTWDREASLQSQGLVKGFAASQYFHVVKTLDNYQSLTQAIDDGTCNVALVIPEDFSLRLNDAGTTSVQLILDATDDNTASVAAGYAEVVVSTYAGTIQVNKVLAQGLPGMVIPLAVQARVWFNEELESKNFVIPGLIAQILALVGAQLSSLTVAREWERGTMELLISTPITPMEVMLGKLIPYFAVGLLDALICVSIALLWFEVPFRGTLFTLVVTTALFLIAVLCIGYFISVVIPNQIGASQMALVVTMMPTMLLSGYIFPIEQMPKAIQAITYFVHARYYVTIIKGVFLKGLGLSDLVTPSLALCLYTLIVGFFAARAFHKTLG